MNRALIVTLIATACVGITASPALAADASTPCVLPGFVSAAGGRPCPASPLRERGDHSVLGIIDHPVGSLFGGIAKGLLTKFVRWVDSSAATALRFTATLISTTTRPAVTSAWFSATYWRVAALSALLTLPFLFAACIHALVRADLAMAARAAFGYLPLAMLGITIAAPLTGLVLAATDEMCAFVSDASGSADTTFLGHAATAITSFSLASGDAFLAFFAGLLTVAATVSLWIELIIRAAAVEVIVLMLPLFFAAMVWPARRVWAIRAIETLIALILSKFAIIAVLTLGASAITQASAGPTALLTGATLVLLAVFSPWALLRVLPLHEVAAAAAGGLSAPPRDALRAARDFATGAPRGGGSGDGGGSDDASSAGPADESGAEAVRERLADTAKPPRPGRRPAAEPTFDPVTEAGLVAINGQGSRGESAAEAGSPAPAASAPSVVGGSAMDDDGRPPMAALFASGTRDDVMVIGDRMPPRSDDGTPAADPPAAPSSEAADVGGGATALAVQTPPADVAPPADADPPPPDIVSPPAAGEDREPWGPTGGQADE
jgi:hypothetical protein